MQGTERLNQLAKQFRDDHKGGAKPDPERVTVRAFLSWFGYERRGKYIVSQIKNKMEELELQTAPDFEGADIGTEVSIDPAAGSLEGVPSSEGLEDPTLRIGGGDDLGLCFGGSRRLGLVMVSGYALAMKIAGAFALAVLVVGCGFGEPTPEPTPRPTPRPKRVYTPKPFPTLAPTPTPSALEKIIASIDTNIETYLDEHGKKGHCWLDDKFEAELVFWKTKSLPYLRTYLDAPYFTERDAQVVLYYLESERGRHARLCREQ